MFRKIMFVIIVSALAVTALAGTAFASQFRGTVVHRNAHAHSFVVAKRTGALVSVHALRLPAPGRRVLVQGRFLSNGTFRASHIYKGALTDKVRLRGVVTFVAPGRGKVVVSAKGVSLAVRARAATGGVLPALGTVILVDGTLDDQGDVTADTVDDEGENLDAADLEGRVVAVDPVARTLTITADDNGDIAGATIIVNIPDGWDMSIYAIGDELEIVAMLNPDGSYTSVGTFQNGDAQEADDQGDDQDGDQSNEQGDLTDLEGQIVAVDPGARTVTLADEDSGTEVVVHIPDTWDMTAYQVDNEVEFSAILNPDGSYMAVQTSEDDD